MQLTKYSLIIHKLTKVCVNITVQARALASQLAESDAVRFMVGTQSLKLSHNQVHVVELNEETGGLLKQVFQHGAGEVWTLAASPCDANLIATCYNTLTGINVIQLLYRGLVKAEQHVWKGNNVITK
jgi:hypothetical protein